MSMNMKDTWHQIFVNDDIDKLPTILAEDVAFHSPVVHTPQCGRDIVCKYLSAAHVVLKNEHFRYLRSFDGDNEMVLEFATEIDGIAVNGVDMIRWNEDSKIIDFKVMVRPLKAIQIVHERMGEELMKKL